MTDELKPCPFCGGDIEVSGKEGNGGLKTAQHPSGDCLLSGQSWWHVPRFIGLWNTRADTPDREALDAMTKRAEEAEAKLEGAMEIAERSIKWLRLYGADVHREATALAELKGPTQ